MSLAIADGGHLLVNVASSCTLAADGAVVVLCCLAAGF